MSEPTVRELATRLQKLESTAQNLKNWAVIVGVLAAVFGYSLKATWTSVSAANRQANKAKEIAESSVGELEHAKSVASGEIQAKGTAILEGYKATFAKWVMDNEAPLIPQHVAIAFTGSGDLPEKWNWCDGKDGRPNLDTYILLGTNDAARNGGVQAGEELVRVSEAGRPVGNITASLYRTRYICR